MKKIGKDSLQLQKVIKGAAHKIQAGLWSLGNDAFLVIVILVLFATFWGEILFYQYIISVVIENPAPQVPAVTFKENVYQSILKEWEAREVIFKGSDNKQYQTPFF